MGAISLLVSLVFGGHRYFVCAQMHSASFERCCARASAPGTQSPGEESGPAVKAEACCTAAHFAAPPPGTLTLQHPALRAPLVALVPVAAPVVLPAPAEPRPRSRLARAGPPLSSARERRLRLMVSLS